MKDKDKYSFYCSSCYIPQDTLHCVVCHEENTIIDIPEKPEKPYKKETLRTVSIADGFDLIYQAGDIN